MKREYVITNEELAQSGLDLNNYALSGDLIPAIIQIGLDIAISRCHDLNDNFRGEKTIEKELDKNTDLVDSFKKLQRKIIWNMIFTAEKSPVDQYIDIIITHELGWGKINGFQKGLYYKNY